MSDLIHSLTARLYRIRTPIRRDERGLSQSAETAILLAGAVTVALLVVALVTAFVKSKLSGL